MLGEQSVTRLFRELKAGSDDAASQLWRRYFRRLVSLARRRLGRAECRAADEEDVALSAFRCLCDGATRGLFPELNNRDELWRLLVKMTGQKVVDHARFTKREKRDVSRVVGSETLNDGRDVPQTPALDQIADDAPTPELFVILADTHERLMSRLEPDGLRQIALWKLEGYTNEEIAERLSVTCRSVERKLQRIRRVWAREFEA